MFKKYWSPFHLTGKMAKHWFVEIDETSQAKIVVESHTLHGTPLIFTFAENSATVGDIMEVKAPEAHEWFGMRMRIIRRSTLEEYLVIPGTSVSGPIEAVYEVEVD